MSSASILYLMHVDWRWIKQRPHFFAEHLAQTHRVTVLHPLHTRRAKYPRNPTQIHRVPLLPSLNWRHRGLGWVDRRAQSRWVQHIAGRIDPDLVWVTHPLLFPYLSTPVAVPVVYDCMDDVLGFEQHNGSRDELAANERALVDSAALVLCSSAHLKSVMAARYPTAARKLELVYNGLSGRLLEQGPLQRTTVPNQGVRVAYIGTIAEWLDTALLTRALDEVPGVYIDLIGPVEAPRAFHERLVYRGIVAHDRLSSVAAEYDAFIMPFHVTELIRSVDPVKLYEYLAFGRETIAVYYDEISRFEPYLHFYSDSKQLVGLLTELRRQRLPSRNDPTRTAEFLRENTWEVRATAVDEHLRRLLASSGQDAPGRAAMAGYGS